MRDVCVLITDQFEATVRRLTASDTHTATRAVGEVAGRTILTSEGSVVVLNAPLLREVDTTLVKRLAAHEAGHVHLHGRREAFIGKQYLVESEWRWRLLCVAGIGVEELRIERALAGLGYPIAGAGSVEHVASSLTDLNIEIVKALVDPASNDAAIFSDAVLSTHGWVAKMLAYAAA